MLLIELTIGLHVGLRRRLPLLHHGAVGDTTVEVVGRVLGRCRWTVVRGRGGRFFDNHGGRRRK